jgi:hypothetical protein
MMSLILFRLFGRLYLNPRFGTTLFLEQGIPDLEYFFRHLPITERGLPISEQGLYFFLSFESHTTRSQKRGIADNPPKI